MLISPTEPALLRAIGKVSSVPETFGSDVLIHSKLDGLVGVQRKELSDLVNSVYNGILAKEIGKMAALDVGVLLIEGEAKWTIDGLLMGVSSSWSQAQHYGLLWSSQARGLWVIQAAGLSDTCCVLPMMERWFSKSEHKGLRSRPKTAGDSWGRKGNREWGVHLLQSFEGVGPELAERIYDSLGVPLQWTVSREELMGVKGMGEIRVERMIGALENGSGDLVSDTPTSNSTSEVSDGRKRTRRR